MNKDVKVMKYAIEPMRKILGNEAISDGGTEKKAEALEGTWIRLNENMFILEEADNATLLYTDDNLVGCACDKFRDSGNLLCEHILAFEDLPNSPQLSIESKEYRWLQEYLLSLGWYVENRYLYPPLDTELPEDKASWAPDGKESEKLDPMNEDRPLDTGVDVEPKPKTYSRKCVYCGDSISGTDLAQVKHDIAEHIKDCPKKPANEKKSSRLVTQDAEEPPQEEVVKDPFTTDAKNATVEKPPKKFACEICGTEYDTSDDVLNCIERCKEKQEMSAVKALVTQDHSQEDWTDTQLEVMRKTVAANATPAEFAYFLNVAKYSGLNPFLKEIYFVKNDKGQTTIITGRDGYLTIAKRDLRFQGIHSMEVCENDEFEMSFVDGVMKVSKHVITNFMDRGDIIGAWACGRMDGQDMATIFASMKEYDKSGNSKGGQVWKQYTSSMMRKVAESMVLKRIAGISGLVTEAEMGGNLIELEG